MMFLFAEASLADVVRIATIIPMTGRSAQEMQQTLDGITRGFESVNRAGGIAGKPVECVLLDNGGTPLGSHNAMKQACQMGVSAVIGPLWSGNTLAAAKVAQQCGVPLLTPTGTHRDITLVGDYIFRTGFTNDIQGIAMARFARMQGYETAVILVDINSDYSLDLGQQFEESFSSSGGIVLRRIDYKVDALDVKSISLQVKELAPEVVVIPGHTEAGFIAKSILEQPVSPVFLGGDAWGNQRFLRTGGKNIPEAYYSTHWSQEIMTVEETETVFLQEKGTAGMALGYDSVLIMADAIRRAGSTSPTAVRDSLAATDLQSNVTGNISFDANGNPAKDVYILRLTNGTTSLFTKMAPVN